MACLMSVGVRRKVTTIQGERAKVPNCEMVSTFYWKWCNIDSK